MAQVSLDPSLVYGPESICTGLTNPTFQVASDIHLEFYGRGSGVWPTDLIVPGTPQSGHCLFHTINVVSSYFSCTNPCAAWWYWTSIYTGLFRVPGLGFWKISTCLGCTWYFYDCILLSYVGNHEYYNPSYYPQKYTMQEVNEKISEICGRFQNVKMAQRCSFLIGNVRG